MSLTLTAACRWSCFSLVRSAQFCELYCPFSFMPHVSCLVLHDSCIMPKASRGGGIHTCMIILPLCFCLTPLGFCSYFSFELSRPHLWRATLLSLALADGCGSHPQMEISGLFLSILLLMEVHFGSLRCLGGWRPCFVCTSGYSWLHVFPPCISPLMETHLPFFEKLFLPPRIMGHFKRLVAGYPALVRFTQLFELFYPFPFHATCHMQRDIHAIMIFPSLFFCPVPLGIYSPSPLAFQVSF